MLACSSSYIVQLAYAKEAGLEFMIVRVTLL